MVADYEIPSTVTGAAHVNDVNLHNSTKDKHDIEILDTANWSSSRKHKYYVRTREITTCLLSPLMLQPRSVTSNVITRKKLMIVIVQIVIELRFPNNPLYQYRYRISRSRLWSQMFKSNQSGRVCNFNEIKREHKFKLIQKFRISC